jgi:DNA-binding NarL/FixJ family response regulator
MTLRIVLADDHRMFREVLRELVEKQTDHRVVGETGDGRDVLELVRANSPDLVIMDIGMPGLNGIEATRQVLAACPQVKVIALSAYCDPRYVSEMLKAGAKGYILKAAAADTLLRAIRTVGANGTYLCPEAAASAVDAVREGKAPQKGATARLGRREREVLQLVAEGLTSAEIAQQLHIAPSTVEVHRRNIMQKLDLHNVAELTMWAVRQGLVSI